MPILTQCPQCGKKLRAPDEHAGRQAKCPQCKHSFKIGPAAAGATGTPAGDAAAGKDASAPAKSPAKAPAPAKSSAQAPAPAKSPAKAPAPAKSSAPASAPVRPRPTPTAAQPDADRAEWYVQTSDGGEYGPVTKTDLDGWLAQDRLDAECQLLKDGWEQWKWAEEVYPQISGGDGAGAEANTFAGVGESTSSGVADNPFAGIAQENPYASPTAATSTSASGGEAEGITEKMVRAIDRTRPWVMFFAVLSFIAAAFAGLGLLSSILTMLASPVAGIIQFLLVGMYVGVYGYTGYLLLTYAKAAGLFARSKGARQLEKALEAQQKFWKFAGILTMVVIGVTILFVILFIVLVGTLFSMAAGGAMSGG